MNKIRVIVFLIFISTSLLSSENLKKISIQLNWKYQFEFAGFIAAKEKGFYKDIGLDVDLLEYKKGTNVINSVKNDKVTFGLYDTSYLNLYDQKKPIVLVANYFKRSALVFITSQDIVIPEDLKGKKVMYLKNELKDSFLGELLTEHKIKANDFISVEHDFTGAKFINGKVDAFSAFVSNELYHVKKAKVPYRIIDPQNYGIIGGGLNLFTSYNNAKKNPIMVEEFLKATNKGWEYAFNNKKELVDIIFNKYSKLKSKAALMFEAKETEKLMMTNIYKVGEVLDSLVLQDIKRAHIDIPLEKLLFNKMNLDNNMSFSKEQKDYILKKKQITMCIDPNWMPYEKIDYKGKHVGITAEYFSLISKSIGLDIKFIPTKSWYESLEFAKKRKCDILSLAQETPSRLKYMNFTKPYIKFPAVIATTTDKLFLPDPESIITKEKVGIVKGYSMEEFLKNKYPNHKIVDVNTIDEGLSKVESGELYGFVDSLPSLAYSLQHGYIDSLKITGKFDRKFELGIAVRNDDKLLYEVLQKGVNSISELTTQKILNKFISVKVEEGYNYKYLYEILLVFFIIGVIAYSRNRQLRKYNLALHETQKELESSLKSFEKLLDSVNEAVFVFDENKKCIQLNKIAIKMFEYNNKDEILGKNLTDLVSEKSYDDVVRNIEMGYEEPYEIIVKKKNGKNFPVLAKGSSSVLNSKKVRISAVIDLSELKQKDKLISQQSKMAAMGEMIENIAHQWRQPLSLISSISTGVIVKKQMGISNDKDEEKELEKINYTSQHLSQTIEDFRNFFRTDKKKKKFSILNSIEKNFMLIEGILKSNDVEIVFFNKDDCLVNSYENEFTQALLNIFYNSRDILVEKNLKQRYIFIDIIKYEKFILIEIMDNGGGIKKEIIEKVFEPYFTTKHQSQGTGIGLYMTHQIIEKHMNGKITVENSICEYNNKKYKGAKFKILIPIE